MREPAPLYIALLEVKSAAGAEFIPVIANTTLALALLVGPGLYWWPAVAFFIHKLLQWMFGHDPYLIRIFLQYVREADHYEPWRNPRQAINKRPFGMGRDLPC
jgi:type IV secretory pathway TrbD component